MRLMQSTRGSAYPVGSMTVLWAVLVERSGQFGKVFWILGATHFPRGVHRQQPDPGVDSFHAQPGCGDRADGRTRGLSVLGHEDLVRNTGLFGPASKLRGPAAIGEVPLGCVDLQDGAGIG